MEKKGSITVFLALILSLLLSLVCTSMESVRMAAARTQILNSMDIGLYSLFGQYDKMLLKDFDLFLLDGSCGGGMLDMASVYDNFEAYMKPVLAQNSQKLSIEQGGFTGYRLLTDENGEVFYQQIVKYMQDTLGSQGVQLLLQRMKDREEKTKEAENVGTQTENGNALENYDSEMNAAAEKSQEAMEEAKENMGEESFGDGNADEITSGTEPVENPISAVKRFRKMGILELVIPRDKGISDNSISRELLLSGRQMQKGMTMYDSLKDDNSATSRILFQQYLMDKLGNFQKPAEGGLRYQLEYILGGKTSDVDNLKEIAKKLLLIREGVNFTCLASDGAKRSQVQALAVAIASGFLIPPASVAIEGALLLCWAFGESILDVRELFDGGKVPLVKSAADWQLSLENLSHLLEGLDSVRKSSDSGMTYEDYLQVMLLSEGKDSKVKRGMDMVEQAVRNLQGRDSFQLDSCIVALEASVDVRANKRKTFTVTKQYCYD